MTNFTRWPTAGDGYLLPALASGFGGGTPTWGGIGTIVGGARCGAFIFIQSARHRDYFLPKVTSDYGEEPAPPSAVWRRNRRERRHAARIALGCRPAGRNSVRVA